MTLVTSGEISNLPNTKHARKDDWNCRVIVSHHYSMEVCTVCHTYPVYPVIKNVSDDSTCFPEGFAYEEYVVHPNPA